MKDGYSGFLRRERRVTTPLRISENKNTRYLFHLSTETSATEEHRHSTLAKVEMSFRTLQGTRPSKTTHGAWTPSIEWCYLQHKCYAPRSRKLSRGGVSSTLCGSKTDTRFVNPGTEVGLGIGPDIGGSFGGRNAGKNFRAPASPIRTTLRATTYYITISALLNIRSVGAVLRCETISS